MNRLPQTLSLRFLQPIAALAFIAALPTPLATAGSEDSPMNAAKNLARMNCGAQIEYTTPDGHTASVPNASEKTSSAAALIMDDDTISCPLTAGETTFVIKLPTTAVLDRFTFVNENGAAAGNLTIAVSNYRLPAFSPKWVTVDGAVAFTGKRLFNLSMVGVEAHYVRLSFNVDKPGRIASFGLYGGETLERFAWRKDQVRSQIAWVANTGSDRHRTPGDQLNFNFANLYAKARVVYVSSGALASAARMIDDDIDTGFHFAQSDRRPTVVVELADDERLHRVSALYKLRAPGQLEVFLLPDLSPEALRLDDHQPVASVADAEGHGKAAIDFDPRGARYVALRWTPLDAASAARGFEIAEIDAFGDMPLALLSASETPDLTKTGYSAIDMPGEGPDGGHRVGALAAPPNLIPLSQ